MTGTEYLKVRGYILHDIPNINVSQEEIECCRSLVDSLLEKGVSTEEALPQLRKSLNQFRLQNKVQ